MPFSKVGWVIARGTVSLGVWEFESGRSFFSSSKFLSLVFLLGLGLGLGLALGLGLGLKLGFEPDLHRSFVSSFSVLRGCPSRCYDLCTTQWELLLRQTKILRKYPCLYDEFCKDFKDKYVKLSLWKLVGDYPGISRYLSCQHQIPHTLKYRKYHTGTSLLSLRAHTHTSTTNTNAFQPRV